MGILKVQRTDNTKTDRERVIRDIILRTRNFQSIQNVCRTAIEFKRMIGIVGEAGLGKTIALNHFANTNQNVFLVTVRPSMGVRTFWMELAEKVCGVNVYGNHSNYPRLIYYYLKQICITLNGLENPLLVIDEAGKMGRLQLLHIHELRDSTKSNLGIVLAGPAYWRGNLEKWSIKRKPGIEELLSRINAWIDLTTPTRFELKKVIEAYGVNDPSIVAGLIQNCGNFRMLNNRITEYLINNS